MSTVFDNSWGPAVSVTVSMSVTVSVSVDPCDNAEQLLFSCLCSKVAYM